jgi:small subunit ribosomal protein S1
VNIAPGSRLKGKVERHESYGVFIFLAPGRTGLMPAGESNTQRGTDLKKAFPVGSELEVQVVEVDPAGKRIRLSRKALLEGEERDDAREFAERRQSQGSFGSIGDKLKAALAAKKS